MIDLVNLEPQVISKDLKGKFMLFYGPPGIGKTELASQFPKSLIMGFEMGTNAINNKYIAPVKDWQEWKQAVSQLVRKKECKEKYDTICIDTADSAWDLCVKYVCDNNDIKSLRDLGWGDGWDQAKKEYHYFFIQIAYEGYGLIFISHASEKVLEDANGKEFTRFQPALQKTPYEIINKMVDITGFIYTIHDEDGNRKRVIFFRETDNFFAKSRFKYIVPKVDFNYNNIVDAIYDAIEKEAQMSGDGTVSEAINPYTNQTFDELIEEAKGVWTKLFDRGMTDKGAEILEKEFGKPTKFSEILPEQIDKLKIALYEIKELL